MSRGAGRRLREALSTQSTPKTPRAPSGPRVIVVGGSLGGLTAGLVLRDAGCDVHVYERSRSALEGRGAGIAVLDATLRYFVEHGIADPAEVCTSTGWIRYLHADGSVHYEEKHCYRFSSWNTIYRGLLSRFDQARYHLGEEMTGFEANPSGDAVDVFFGDGRVEQADLLVCADGIGSTCRQHLLPDVAPAYAGYVAWRGTIPEATLRPESYEVLWDAITYQLLANSHILVYPIPGAGGELEPGRRLVNFVWYRNVDAGGALTDLMTDRGGVHRPASLPPGAVQDRHVEEVRATAAAELAPPIAEVVLSTPEPFVQVIFDIEVPVMAFGRVCLMGDAAFAVRPHAAAGTAKAAADAWALAEAVADAGGDVVEALRRWEPGQLALGSQLIARAREIGNRSQFEGTWIPGDRKLIFGLYEPGR
ncbi:MAG: FAD binding domain-containing protein [Actinomycetota bacterium]|nr:FAD binding domain-containing protein [Actinomycetota bacterium]